MRGPGEEGNQGTETQKQRCTDKLEREEPRAGKERNARSGAGGLGAGAAGTVEQGQEPQEAAAVKGPAHSAGLTLRELGSPGSCELEKGRTALPV